jgi:hypothetical protein
MLTAGNIKTFKKAYKELYDFAMVRPEYFSACVHCRVACLNPLLYAECDHSLSEEIREAESSCEWSPRACCPGKAHLRREDEELLSAEGARHAEIGKDSRDLATQERPAIREDLKVSIYQSQEADNTFITSDGTSPYNSTR